MRVIYAIPNALVILARNEMRGGNLLLSGTVTASDFQQVIKSKGGKESETEYFAALVGGILYSMLHYKQRQKQYTNKIIERKTCRLT